MRKIIAALITSLDGLIEGPNGEPSCAERTTRKDMHAVGGAKLVSSLMNAGLVDELRIVVSRVAEVDAQLRGLAQARICAERLIAHRTASSAGRL